MNDHYLESVHVKELGWLAVDDLKKGGYPMQCETNVTSTPSTVFTFHYVLEDLPGDELATPPLTTPPATPPSRSVSPSEEDVIEQNASIELPEDVANTWLTALQPSLQSHIEQPPKTVGELGELVAGQIPDKHGAQKYWSEYDVGGGTTLFSSVFTNGFYYDKQNRTSCRNSLICAEWNLSELPCVLCFLAPKDNMKEINTGNFSLTQFVPSKDWSSAPEGEYKLSSIIQSDCGQITCTVAKDIEGRVCPYFIATFVKI